MKKVIIGIIPGVKKNENNPYEYKYIYLNSYSKAISNNNAIPIGLLLNDESIDEESLNICDGFLFPGGKKLEKAHFDIILHAIKHNKPILGICLGMQVLNYFSILKEELTKKNLKITIKNLWDEFEKIKNEDFFKLKEIEIPNIHGYKIMQDKIECNYQNILKSKHNITINKDSILYDIYKTENLEVISLHLKKVTNVSEAFYISAKASDGIIEALEYKDKNNFILGVQFHPELNDNKIFEYFINEVKKRNV